MREVEKNIYWKYFDDQGFIIGDLSSLPRKNSPYPMESREYCFEILNLDGDKEIRFAVQKAGDCGCRNFIIDSSELIHVRDWLDNKCCCKPDLFDEFKFNIHEEHRLKKMISDVYPPTPSTDDAIESQ